MTGWWPSPAPPPATVVVYTALCPAGRPAQWLGELVDTGNGDGARVVCLCRCPRCLLAVAGVAVAPC